MNTFPASAPQHRQPRGTGIVGGRGLGVAAITLVALHVPLGLSMSRVPYVSTAHALLTFGVGLFLASFGKRPEAVAYVGAYVAGAEVLWRMTNAATYWEFGKYATVFLFLIALFRFHRLRPPRMILFYFILLLPSAVLTFANSSLSEARQEISYNLSGPLALTVSVWYCFYLRLSRMEMARIMTVMIAPIVGVGAIAGYGTLSAGALAFGRGSNLETSGGFGPNQVSAVLGLGTLLALILVLLKVGAPVFRFAMFWIAIALGAQSALTFSRSGLVITGICLLFASLQLARSRQTRVGVAVVGTVLFLVAYFLVVPRLAKFTGGALVERFQDRNLTGRDDLAKLDLVIFREHPWIGVGPGEARALRSKMGHGGIAHTEFTRMLAEHGLLGLGSLCLLVATGIRALRAARGSESKAIVTTLLGWSLLFMLVNGMRLVAPAFVFGLACAALSRNRARVVLRDPRQSIIVRSRPRNDATSLAGVE